MPNRQYTLLATALFLFSSNANALLTRPFYIDLSLGNLVQTHESTQIRLAESSDVFSEDLRYDLSRGAEFYPFKKWAPALHLDLNASSNFEIKQHENSVALANFLPERFTLQPLIGLSSLYHGKESFIFVQSNLGLFKTNPNTIAGLQLNIPVKRHGSYQSTLNNSLYAIAAGQPSHTFSDAQKKEITNTLLNQHLTDPSTIANAFDAIIALQSNAKTNQTINYKPIFEQYSTKTADLYHPDLVAANKSGVYDYIAQYGAHLIFLKPHAYKNSVLTASYLGQLSFYEKQTLLTFSTGIMDLTGHKKSILTLAQIVYQENQLQINGSLSIQIYFGKPESSTNLLCQRQLTSASFVNFTQHTFQATNLT